MYMWAKIRIPEFRGGDKWSSYLVQFRIILKMHECYDNDVMVFKLVEALRGHALEYYNSLPAETRCQISTLCTLFKGRFGTQEPPATTRSNPKTIIQRVDEPLPDFFQIKPFEWQQMAIQEWEENGFKCWLRMLS